MLNSEVFVFAKEMLEQKPSRGMLKIYVLGSTLAMLGMIGGLVENVFLPVLEDPSLESKMMEELFMKKRKGEKQVLKPCSALVLTEEEDMLGTVLSESKAKHLATAGRRGSSNRLYAS
ncbi:G0/G1 switch protein 2 [Cololabis saira]|uniref:G0/G1 switch protein 2 n=1 Tax=Cololabis saira TaxID=129043 RepID=UPI002AD2A129|nr:G0/G1 switch protein 2 [Cololabis saira]